MHGSQCASSELYARPDPASLLDLPLSQPGLPAFPQPTQSPFPAQPVPPYLAIPNLILRLIYLHLCTPSFPGLLSLNLYPSRSAHTISSH